jgi:hypothetical protein
MAMVLCFTHRGKNYQVNEDGMIKGPNSNEFSSSWTFLGVSFHHWRQSIDVHWLDAFENPKSIIGGIVWDVDHGTTRKWGGQFHGKLPRITNAFVI